MIESILTKFMNNPPLETQKIIYQDLESEKKFVVGEDVYLISYQWLRKFQNDTGFFNRPSGMSTCGPIDNKPLMTKGIFIPDKKREKFDYEILSKDMWDTLNDWYKGGPEIKCPVVNSITGPKVLLSKLNLKCYYRNSNPKDITTHKYEIVKNLRIQIMKEFQVPSDKKARLWDYWKKEFKNEMKDDNELSKYNLYDNQELYLDVFENGEWDKDNQKNFTFDPIQATVESQKLNQSSDQYNSNFNNNYNNNQVNVNQVPSYNDYNNNYPINASDTNQIPDFPKEKAPAPGVVGLFNIGNTCFFNAGVQCLLHNIPLINIFLHSKWENEINTNFKHGTRGELAKAFGALMQQVWSGENKIVTPSKLKLVIGQYAPQFSNTDQQDSHEFLTFLLTGLHEDLNRRNDSSTQINSIVGNGSDDEKIAIDSWKEFKKKNDSVITDHFYGQFRSTLKCPECNSITTVFDPYNIISLPMSSHNKGLKVTFIPLKFTDNYVKMNLEIPPFSKFDDVSRIVSNYLGKNVNVYIGGYRILDDIEWGVGDYSETSQPHLCAFEVNPEDSYLIPCTIEMCEKNEIINYGYGSSGPNIKKTIGKPFLLSFGIANPTEMQIAQRAREYLNCFWEPYNGPVNDYVKDIISQGKYFAEPVNANQRDMPIIAEVKYYDGSKSIKYDQQYPKLAKTFVKIYLNPDYIGNENGLNQSINTSQGGSGNFSYYALFCHQKQKKEKSVDYNNPQITLEDCFSIFSQDETLDADNKWHCPKCNKDVCANKKMDLWSAPDSLIINLKRFGVMNSKLETFVGYPLELDLADFIIGPQNDGEDLIYRLYGVTEHMGGVGFGHYTAHVRVVQPDDQNGKWYLFNDSGVSDADENSAINRSAYVLFYQRAKPGEPEDAL